MFLVHVAYTYNIDFLYGYRSRKGMYMQGAADNNSKLPFKCRMTCLSLVGGSLVLAIIYIVFYMGYISAVAALWAAGGVFVLAALYESCLLSLIARQMLNKLNKNSDTS